jgi:hypothetical protein
MAMAIRAQSERRFGKSSHVARYWLAQCEGFRVQGRVKGTVEEVVGSVDHQTVERLVVRRAWRRRSLPAEAIEAVVPAARLIVVEGEPEHAHHSVVEVLRGLSSIVAMVVTALGRALLRIVRQTAVLAVRALVDARARWQAGAEQRRRESSRRPRTASVQHRKLTRAAVLGIERRGGHRP